MVLLLLLLCHTLTTPSGLRIIFQTVDEKKKKKSTLPGSNSNAISFSNNKFVCFSCIIAILHQNSPTVKFWWEKIESNLMRANTEPGMDFRGANTEPSLDFKKANAEPPVHFRRDNTETYWK